MSSLDSGVNFLLASLCPFLLFTAENQSMFMLLSSSSCLKFWFLICLREKKNQNPDQLVLLPLSLFTSTFSLTFCRYGPSPQLRGHEEGRDWLRSHSTSGLQESASNSPFSPGSSLTSPSGTRFNFGQLGMPHTLNSSKSAIVICEELLLCMV